MLTPKEIESTSRARNLLARHPYSVTALEPAELESEHSRLSKIHNALCGRRNKIVSKGFMIQDDATLAEEEPTQAKSLCHRSSVLRIFHSPNRPGDLVCFAHVRIWSTGSGVSTPGRRSCSPRVGKDTSFVMIKQAGPLCPNILDTWEKWRGFPRNQLSKERHRPNVSTCL